MSESKIKYKENALSRLEKELGPKNRMAYPRLVKIVVNSGVGRREEKEIELIMRQLEMITGQKCAPRKAKQSIATFKTRKGMIVGLSCTLRGNRMYDFFERMISIALPRIRDFRGIDPKTIDSSGNLTIGFKEHIVFPEIAGEDVKIPFGLEATLVSSAGSKKEAEAFFRVLGIPFKK